MDSGDVLKILWKGVRSKGKYTTKQSEIDLIKVKKEEDDSDVEPTTENRQEAERIRKSYNLSVKGTNVPSPLKRFSDLTSKFGLSQRIVDNLKSGGYDKPTPIQMQAIPTILGGRQVLACAPTGSGKTIAFLAPILGSLKKTSKKGVRALILTPTRELAKQIYRESTLLGDGTDLKIVYVTKIRQNDDGGGHLSKKVDVLISTPNRLIHLMRLKPDLINLSTVEWLIVDESDKLFEAGMRGFRDQLAEIYKACDNENIKRGMFSATYTVHVARWCRKNLSKVVEITVGHRNTAVDKVEQELIYVGNESGKLLAFRDLIRRGITPPVLVFVQSKDRAKQLFNELIYDGINVDVIHSERTQHQRDNVVKAFREGTIWVLICTDVLGRGIDFVGVKLVVNYDFPTSAISYIHRIGRSGRAGLTGRAVTYFTDQDRSALRTIARVMKDSGCPVPEYMLSLKKISKRERLKMENVATEREDISTDVSKLKRFKSQGPRPLKRKKLNSET